MAGNSRDDRAHSTGSRPWARTERPVPVAAGLAAAAALAAMLAACGGSSGSGSGSPSGGSSTSAGGSTATASAPATQAAGGSMGCLAGTWRSNNITDANLSLKGGSGAVLTISSDGHFVMNVDRMARMTFAQSGVTGSVMLSGQETGTFRVVGSKLGGVYHPGTLAASADLSGLKFKLPLSKLGVGAHAMSWQSFSCSGNTLTMINPPPASTWTFSRTG